MRTARQEGGKEMDNDFLVRLGTNLFFSISRSWYVRRSTNTESDSCRIADRSIFTNTVNVLKLPVLRVISSISAKKKGGLESVLLVQGVQEFGVHSVEELNVTCCRLHRSLENHGQEAHCNWEFFFKIVPIFAQTCDCNNNSEAN